MSITDNHKSVLTSFNVSIKDNDCDLPTLYWTPKLHKCSYKQRFISGSARCTTKPSSLLLTSILTAIKTGLQGIVRQATLEAVSIKHGY